VGAEEFLHFLTISKVEGGDGDCGHAEGGGGWGEFYPLGFKR
jgi:hypothetical protein